MDASLFNACALLGRDNTAALPSSLVSSRAAEHTVAFLGHQNVEVLAELLDQIAELLVDIRKQSHDHFQLVGPMAALRLISFSYHRRVVAMAKHIKLAVGTDQVRQAYPRIVIVMQTPSSSPEVTESTILHRAGD